jgi:diguanylate cyclase (GGDEF)-like protein
MPRTKDQQFKCPLGDQDCQWQDEIVRLQSQVDELAELVSQDPLTGLYNVRHFKQILPQIMERARRMRHVSCLIMMDLDNFKSVNDNWGHEVGNLALKQTAEILTQHVRMIDTVCRYGGEEFAIVLPDTQLRQGVYVAERIHTSLEETPLTFVDSEVRLTASLGIEVYDSDTQVTPQALIDAADRFLYQAKNDGRNRIAHRDLADVESSTAVSQEEREALFTRSDDVEET